MTPAPSRTAMSTIPLPVSSIAGVDAWGKRKLAYEIDHMGDAWYYVLTFESEPEALHEATRVLAITDGVMRHMADARPHRASRTAAPAEPEPAEATA